MKLVHPREVFRLAMSLPARERGLKHCTTGKPVEYDVSLPARERGLKLFLSSSNLLGLASLPARERGLKLFGCYKLEFLVSLPARERGLKPNNFNLKGITGNVAPRAGAWIETSNEI